MENNTHLYRFRGSNIEQNPTESDTF